MKSKERIFLNDEILTMIERKFHSRCEGDYTSDALSEDLREFITENDANLPTALMSELRKNFPSESAVRHACQRKHFYHGANESLRDLLCFYAFGTSWENQIGKEQLANEIKWSRQLKEQLKGKPKDIIVSQLGKIDNNVVEILSRLGSPTRLDDFGLGKAAERYNNATKYGRILEKEESAREILKGLTSQITMRTSVRAYIHFELLGALTVQGKYHQVIEQKDAIRQSGSYLSHASYLIANAFNQLERYKEALDHLEITLKEFPEDVHTICMKAMCLRGLENITAALQVTSDAINLYRQGELINAELHFDATTYEVIPVHCPATEESIGLLLKIHSVLLAESGNHEEAIRFASLPECESDLNAQLFLEAYTNPTNRKKILALSEQLLRREYHIKNMVTHLELLITYGEEEETILKFYQELVSMNKLAAKAVLFTYDRFTKYRDNHAFTRLVQ